jgi:flavin reductase (DIM6/NTAB) family NADH-FMN oxidoreductase RutF
MDDNQKKIALRMIPYGLYVLTAESKSGKIAAATVNWVTQTSFKPPLVVVGVRVDSFAHTAIRDAGSFALNILGKKQNDIAFTFFKPQEREDMSIGGQPFQKGVTGSPIFENLPAFIECNLAEFVEKGDHSIFVGEVVNAGVKEQAEGRADEKILWLKELGENIYYGG